MLRKVAINAANLHVGGGVQVATSFIQELEFIKSEVFDFDIFASSDIHKNLESIGSSIIEAENYHRLDVHGLSTLFSELNAKLAHYDAVFTVFGPSYLRPICGKQIVGFAQPWIIYKEGYALLPSGSALKARLKFFLQSLFFRRADRLIVELDHVKHGLVSSGIARAEQIDIVYNCISPIYLEPEKWAPLNSSIKKSGFSIGFLGRDYPHKNTSLLSDIHRILQDRYRLDVDFYVTMNEMEWAAKTPDFRRAIFNVGPLTVAQCPSYYEAMDAIIFPSLLECFSATPLEAMVMGRPLFASDRRFIRDVCSDFARYFDPLRPESAAAVIACYLNTQRGKDLEQLEAARTHAVNFSNARERARHYIKIIERSLIKQNT